MAVTQDTLAERWPELKGAVKQRWSKLTDEDLASPHGKSADLVAALQKRYGYGKAQAQMEIDQWLSQRAAGSRP